MRTLKDMVTVGSWVKFKNSDVFTKLTESSFEGDYINETFEGIEIENNYDFLGDFGFSKSENSWFWDKKYDKRKDSFKIAFHPEYYIWFLVSQDDGLNSECFLYIHDLQRFFKKITGIELLNENVNNNLEK